MISVLWLCEDIVTSGGLLLIHQVWKPNTAVNDIIRSSILYDEICCMFEDG